MKAYKVEILIVNHDRLTEQQIKEEIENTNYANDCISPNVMKIEGKDIGEWYDEHPLNYMDTMHAEYKRLFDEQ